MARFYKTASAAPIDYMYRINTPLMEKVIQRNDEYITQNLQQAANLGSLASSFQYLEPDSERTKEIVSGYNKTIDEITSAIREDPANWKKQMTPMREVSRKLQQDYTTGEISRITSNYGKYKAVSDYIDKQVEEYNKSGKGISADRAMAYKSHFLKNFGGTNYNPQTGTYETINAFDPMGNIDIRKRLSEEMDKIKADSKRYKKSEVTGEEWYFNDKTEKWEGITPQKILSIATDRLNDPQLMQYLRQDSQIGLIGGVFDDEGKFIAPYEYKGVTISPEEQKNIENFKKQISKTKDPNLKAQMQNQLAGYEEQLNQRTELNWNDQSYLAPIMRGIVNQFAYSQTDEENTLRSNSKGSTKYTQAQINARDAANRASREALAREREKGVNDRFDKTMEWNKYKFENPQEKKTGTGTGTKKGGKDEKTPIENSVSRLSTNSFETWTTTNEFGEEVKVLSNSGLSNDINRLKTQESTMVRDITTIDKQMKSYLGNRKFEELSVAQQNLYNSLRVKKEALQRELPKVQSDLNARRVWYKASTDAALSNNPNAKKDGEGDLAGDLTPEEIALYNKYKNDRQANNLRDDIAADAESYLFPSLNKGKVSGISQWMQNTFSDPNDPQFKKRKEYTDYLKVKQKVDKRRDNFLASIRYTPIDTDAVQLGEKDSELFTRELLANPQGLTLYDNTGNKTSGILDSKGVNLFGKNNRPGRSSDNYNMSFIDNDLVDYIDKNNVKVKMEQMGNTTKIGSGNAVVKLTFNDPNGEIDKRPYYVELTTELQRRFATKLSSDKSLEVQKIAGNMLDDDANDIRRQLITPTVQRKSGSLDNADPVTFTIFINNGNQRVPLQVTKFVSSDGTDKLNITQNVDGVPVPLTGTQSGINGWFNGPDDFINYIKGKKQEAQKFKQSTQK
jgi:hypothetical protein